MNTTLVNKSGRFEVKSMEQIVTRRNILAFFIHHSQWGVQIRGDERRFLEISKQLKSLGVIVHTIELDPSLQDSLNESFYHSLKVAPSSKLAYKGFLIATYIHLIFAALRLSLKVRYDFIYVHNQDLLNMIPAYILKLVCRKPLVLVFHGFLPIERVSFKDALVSRIKDGCSPHGALLDSLLRIVKHFICQKVDFCITTSRTNKNDAVRYLKARKIIIAGNGVNADKFRSQNLEKIYEAAFLGRVHPQKNLEVLLKAWRGVVVQNPSAKLVIIGGGKEVHIEYYRAFIDKLDLRKNVEMKGFVSDEDLVILLNSSKLFIFPSLYEGFAIAVAEAMACGLPCVISDIPVFRELYSNVAILRKPIDVKGFTDVILKLLRTEEKRKELGKKAREYVKKFDWKDIARKELEVINNLVR